MRSVALLSLMLLGGLTPPARLAAQPKELPPNLVAPTDALSPADEHKAFTVPEGFDVQLVASEPYIQKPMQMAWDAKGRLWVTTSYHYPFAAEPGKATDKLFVLWVEESERARRITARGVTETLEEQRLALDPAFRSRLRSAYEDLGAIPVDASGSPDQLVADLLERLQAK